MGIENNLLILLLAFLTCCFIFILGQYYVKRLIIKKLIIAHTLVSSVDYLKEHLFFNSAHYRLAFDIPKIVWFSEKPVRTRILKDLLYQRIYTIKSLTRKFVMVDMKECDKCNWGEIAHNLLNEIDENFIKNCLDVGIPEIILEKFLNWHSGTMNLVRGHINVINDSKIFNTPLEKTNTFLFILNLTLTTTVGDAEKTLNTLNGEIKGLEYNNNIIEDI